MSAARPLSLLRWDRAGLVLVVGLVVCNSALVGRLLLETGIPPDERLALGKEIFN
jgi:hypothetical protein